MRFKKLSAGEVEKEMKAFEAFLERFVQNGGHEYSNKPDTLEAIKNDIRCVLENGSEVDFEIFIDSDLKEVGVLRCQYARAAVALRAQYRSLSGRAGSHVTQANNQCLSRMIESMVKEEYPNVRNPQVTDDCRVYGSEANQEMSLDLEELGF